MRSAQKGHNLAGYIFPVSNWLYFIDISLKFVPNGPTDIVTLDSGLAQYKRQAITWTNDDQICRRIWRRYGSMC